MIAINLNNFCKGNRTSGKTRGGRGRPVPWEELFCNSEALVSYRRLVFTMPRCATQLLCTFILVREHS